MRFKILFVTLFLILINLLEANPAKASEGEAVLYSNTDADYRCWIASGLMQDNQYTILARCSDLIYPVSEDIFVYVVWANPSDGSRPIKLGELGLGRQTFRTNKAFSSVFVTTEKPGYREPAGRVVMRGSMQSIDVLTSPTTPTPTPESGSGSEEETATPEKQLTTRERILTGLRRAGLVALVALVALIGLVFVITRSRG